MATVRIPDELNERLKVAADDLGVSVTTLVAELCRRGLASAPAPPSARAASVARPRARAGVPVGKRGKNAAVPFVCGHPPGRRIESMCMVCGSKVGPVK